MADEPSIANESQKIAAQIVVTMDQQGRVHLSFPKNEMVCDFLLKKATELLDAEWRKANTPMVAAINGKLPMFRG